MAKCSNAAYIICGFLALTLFLWIVINAATKDNKPSNSTVQAAGYPGPEKSTQKPPFPIFKVVTEPPKEQAIVITGGSTNFELYFPNNPIRNRHSQVKPNFERYRHVATAVGNSTIFIAGGDSKPDNPLMPENISSSTEICSFASGECRSGPPMLSARAISCSVLFDHKWYIFGGIVRKPSYTEDFILDSIEVLDVRQPERWQKAGNLLIKRGGCAAVRLHRFIYIFGGHGLGDIKESERLEPAAITETDSGSVFAASLPRALHAPAAAEFARKIFVCGGLIDDDFESARECYRYDMEDDDKPWKLVSRMVIGRHFFSLLVVNDVMFAVSGEDMTGWDFTGSEITVEKWRPNRNESWAVLGPVLLEARSSCVAVVLNL